MFLSDITDRLAELVSLIVRLTEKFDKVFLYGTSIESFLFVNELTYTKIFEKISGIIETESVAFNVYKNIPIIKKISENTEADCVVILDYIYSLYASQILFADEAFHVVNVYSNSNFYEKKKIVNTTWIAKEKTEEELVAYSKNTMSRPMVNKFVEMVDPEKNVIRAVEIETINRCNGHCSFCPVNASDDPRPLKYMDTDVFKKIIRELSLMNYTGKLSLFSNNEPLLDKRILDFHKYAKEKLPQCKMHMFTNGRKLSVELFLLLMNYLDEMIIDVYSDEFEIPSNIKKIIELCEQNEELASRLTVVLRKQNEILSTRGGESKVRSLMPNFKTDGCALPFQQMIIRPTGEVSLCCNDPLGRYTLGNVRLQTLSQIWTGEKYKEIRSKLKVGRGTISKCSLCDSFYYYW